MALKDRLDEAMLKKKISCQELADAIGAKYSTVAAWRNGRTKSIRGALLLETAKTLDVDPIWLQTGQQLSNNVLFAEIDDPSKGAFAIKKYNVNIGCGHTSVEPTYDELLDTVPIYKTESWFVKHHVDPEDCRALVVSGDSMSPLINDGDTVIVDTSVKARSHYVPTAVYAIFFDDYLMCKQLVKKINGTLVIHSLNPKYEDEVVEPEEADQLSIIGRVLERSGEINIS